MSLTSRRSFLHGVGGSLLALPWLESTAASSKPKTPAQRIAFYYVPIGIVRRDFFPGEQDFVVAKYQGTDTERWNSPEFKPGSHPLELTKTLAPLESIKDKVTLITGLDRTFQNGTDVHAQCASGIPSRLIEL